MAPKKVPRLVEQPRESLKDAFHRMNQNPEVPRLSDVVAAAPPVSGAADAVPGAPAALLSTAVNDPTHVDVVNVTNLQCPPRLDHVRMLWSRFCVFSGHTAGAYHHGRRCCCWL